MFSKTVIIGRLGNDPKLATSKSGKDYCSFSVAVTTGYGENKQTDWFNVTVFGNQAKSCAQCLSKGSLAAVDGVIHADAYEGKDGKPKASISLFANDVKFLSPKSEQSKQPQAMDDDAFDPLNIPF